MWLDHSVARPRRYRSLSAVLAVVPALVLGAVACNSNTPPPPPKVIFDKATPYADLLVPRLQASVTDGAVGVAVDQPVTVTAGDGVLGEVSLVRPDGTAVAGQLSPHRPTRAAPRPPR